MESSSGDFVGGDGDADADGLLLVLPFPPALLLNKVDLFGARLRNDPDVADDATNDDELFVWLLLFE